MKAAYRQVPSWKSLHSTIPVELIILSYNSLDKPRELIDINLFFILFYFKLESFLGKHFILHKFFKNLNSE